MDKYPSWYTPLVVDIPEGESGNWKIEQFTVSEDQAKFDNMRSAFHGSRRYVRSGTYTRLVRGRAVIMSDTVDEVGDMLEPIREAKNRGGDVLINGLGLGVVVNGMLQNENVGTVTVIELSQDVIDLVGKYWLSKYPNKLNIIQGDALTWSAPKGKKYSVVWHDIWDNICTDNLEQMKKLHRRYGKRSEWQGSWCRADCEYYNSRGICENII